MSRKLMAGLVVITLTVTIGCQSTAMTSAKVYIQQNDWAQAREQLLLAVAATPHDTEAQMLLGVAESTAGNLSEAAAAFDVADADPDPARVAEASRWRRKFWVETFNLGLEALNDGAFVEAVDLFVKATTIDPKGAMAYRNLGIIYERQERPDEAIAAYETAIILDPEDTSTALQLGYVHYQEERWQEAIALIAPRVFGAGDAGYYRLLASAYDHLDQSDDSLEALKSAMELDPEDAELLNDVAGIYLRRDDYATAASYLEKIFLLSPEDNLVGHNYAVALIRIEDETKAMTVLEAVIANDDQFADGWELLSQLYLRADRFTEGQEAYDKAEKLRSEANREVLADVPVALPVRSSDLDRRSGGQ